MGNRLSKIYTRTGDLGETGLGDGSRIPKDSRRLDAMGHIDEFNAALGVVISELPDSQSELAKFLAFCQHKIFDVGGEISIPGAEMLKNIHVQSIEAMLDNLNDPIPPLKNFILPGGSRLLADLHLARAICRRAERALVSLSKQENINPYSLQILNRLSDLLFVCARHIAQTEGIEEVLWEQEGTKS